MPICSFASNSLTSPKLWPMFFLYFGHELRNIEFFVVLPVLPDLNGNDLKIVWKNVRCFLFKPMIILEENSWLDLTR